jgi:hypothetical protein
MKEIATPLSHVGPRAQARPGFLNHEGLKL